MLLSRARSWIVAIGLSVRNFWRRIDSWGAEPAQASPRRDRDRVLMVALALAVCVTIFIVKTVIVFRDCDNPAIDPYLADGELLPTLGRVFLCCAEDFAVGFGCLLAADLALRLVKRRWGRLTLRSVALAAAAIAASYMIVNAQLFHSIRHFLNWSLFMLGGGFKPERSIRESTTLSVKLAVGLTPLAMIILMFVLLRVFPGGWHWLTRQVCRPARLLVLIVCLSVTATLSRGEALADYNGDLTRNPHLMWFASYARALLGEGARFGDLWDDGTRDHADFQPGQPRLAYADIEQRRARAQLAAGSFASCGLEPVHVLPALSLRPGEPRRPRNIVLIVLESGCSVYMQNYAAPWPTTPGMSALADKSIVFEPFYSTATHTIASALPLFGAQYNNVNDKISTVVDHPDYPVPAVSSWLQQHGYKTFFFGAGGKSVWQDYRNIGPAFLPHGFDLSRCGHRHWSTGQRDWPFLEDSYGDAAMFYDAARAIEEVKSDRSPFFVMLWNTETHYPYEVGEEPAELWNEDYFPASTRGSKELRDNLSRYLTTLWRVDRLIADLHRRLEDAGLADDTLIVVTGDHGEAFGQHSWLTHGHSLHEEEIRVPLVFINSRIGHLGLRRQVVGSHIDLWPTISDVCGIPPDPRWQGRSLLDDQGAPHRAYFHRPDQLGVRQGKWKYIWDYSEEIDLLFDLEADPEERNNVAAAHRVFCLQQRRRLRDWTEFQAQLNNERLGGGTR